MITIKRATPDRLAALDSLIARAFGDQPMVRWPLGGSDEDYLGRLTRQLDAFNEPPHRHKKSKAICSVDELRA